MITPLFPAFRSRLAALGRQTTHPIRQTTITQLQSHLGDLLPAPSPSGSGSGQTTTTYYNTSLQATNVVLPDGNSRYTTYYLSGENLRQWGGREYPVEYTFDYAGRKKTIKTWKNFSGNSGTALTTWNYDTNRGWLLNKRYADNTGPDYTYTPAGRLRTRAWARIGTGGNRVTATYSYGFDGSAAHGDLAGIVYSNDPQSKGSNPWYHSF